MEYKIIFEKSVLKELQKIDNTFSKRILNLIKTELAFNPGKDKALTGNHKGLFSYRIGDYRVIYKIQPENLLILRIGHRKDIYKK